MKKNKYIMTLTMIIILLVSSIGMYMCYPYIHNNEIAASKEQNIIDYMGSQIFYSSYAISQELDKQANINTSLESYIQAPEETSSQQIKSSFIEAIHTVQKELTTQTSYSFIAKNTKTNQTISNTDDNLLDINNNKELADKYQWYITVQYDSEGNVSYQNQQKNHNSLESAISSTHSSYNTDYEEYDYDRDEDILIHSETTYPKDITITYAIEKNIDSSSELASYLSNYSVSLYMRFAVPYILAFCVVISIIILLIPMQYLETIPFLNIVSKIKFGILAFLWCFLIGTLLSLVPFFIHGVYTGEFVEFFTLFGIESFAPILTPVIQIVLWFVFFTLIVILMYMIKYLFQKGFKRYFKENTCLGWIILNSQKIMNKIVNFDLDDNINRSVLKIVIFNFIIITVISIFFVFGFFFALIYSIIIFFLLKNKFVEIKNDYQVLLNATKKLSNGQFDVDINEDVGIFNPLKNEFTHIKDGFEKAVKEEVKSQKMKTELISNVSHDLKTPLTSIITYVDLLKKDALTDEERHQYIQVLERNSLRLKNLIDDLFEVSKANSGDIKLHFVDVDIVSLIKQAELECQDKLDEKSLDIKMNTSHEKIIHSLDSSKTYRIFENLFINISKYALDHTRVYIDVIEDEDNITIIFKNISEQEITFNNKEIVERFVQGDKSRNTTGSGLGLAIVKSFTELQKGQFQVETDGDLFKSIITFHK
ncbi:sensor histidine kinase [Candidatus Stoquefichus sp. SB1]|uniref:sensor histidine kinase n=1 Tax=Candidatus Stoquefichus sp. SB1 TaxID=1658109 RepID=UPI00067E933F|nr:HAMP domain-containing sensor histidine kinase [Candidatus Stoquefichus sp. SB1]